MCGCCGFVVVLVVGGVVVVAECMTSSRKIVTTTSANHQQLHSHTYTYCKFLSTPSLGNLHTGNVKVHVMSLHCCRHFITVFPVPVIVTVTVLVAAATVFFA